MSPTNGNSKTSNFKLVMIAITVSSILNLLGNGEKPLHKRTDEKEGIVWEIDKYPCT